MEKRGTPSRRYQAARGLVGGVPIDTRDNVYFVQDGEAGWIKIGYATDLGARLRQLQCGNPRPLTLLAAMRVADAPGVEDHLHTCFHDDRGLGEWFRPSPELARFLRVRARSASPEDVIDSVIFLQRGRSLRWSIDLHGLSLADWRLYGDSFEDVT